MGYNYTDLTASKGIGQGKNGWQTGASVTFGEKMHVEPGIFCISKRAEFTDPNVTNPVDFDSDLNGIRIRHTLRMNLIGSSETLYSWRALGGASVFFETSVREDLDPDEVNSPGESMQVPASISGFLLLICPTNGQLLIFRQALQISILGRQTGLWQYGSKTEILTKTFNPCKKGP